MVFLKNIIVIVDYVYIFDVLKNVLEIINLIRMGNEELIIVVGCGGNCDVEKRLKMGNIVVMLSIKVIFISDNLRNENFEIIIEVIEKGVLFVYYKKIFFIIDRK